jgi:F-type H+-transporting ATPase subunit delta
MKISSKQYAGALYEATKNKEHREIDVAVLNFFNILVKSNQLKVAPKIIGSFKKIWNKEEGIVEAEVITRVEIEKGELRKVESYIKERYKAEKVVIINKIDENIKGGVIIKIGDEVLDGSIANQLRNLKNNLSK